MNLELAFVREPKLLSYLLVAEGENIWIHAFLKGISLKLRYAHLYECVGVRACL